MIPHLATLSVLIALGLSSQAHAESYPATVIKISDGDTLQVIRADTGERVKVRLIEIDAPEKKQPWGPQATEALRSAVAGKAVTVDDQGRDRYKRTLGRVFVENRDVNADLVRTGNAWVFVKYAKDAALPPLEAEARAARRGLWGLPEGERMPPWEWRAMKRAH